MKRDGQYVQGTRQEYDTVGEPNCGQAGGICFLKLQIMTHNL